MRTAAEVIDQAIKENRFPEYLLYAFAALFVLTGETIIGFALLRGSGVTAVAGVALNGLAWPAYYATRQIRAENLMLRMLEVPLNKAKTSTEAAKVLTDTFRTHFNAKASNTATTDIDRPQKTRKPQL
jgi:hypothetical protein